VLTTPTADGDSIAGEHRFGRIAFSTSDVRLIEEQRFSSVRTGVVAGIAVLGFTLFKTFFQGDRVTK
jgi:hypothetical protein